MSPPPPPPPLAAGTAADGAAAADDDVPAARPIVAGVASSSDYTGASATHILSLWLGGVTLRTLDLRSRCRGFDSRSGRRGAIKWLLLVWLTVCG